MPTALAVAGAALGRLPFTLGERALVAWKRRRMAPMPAPIFIVGHWRSGTTHLSNLLTRSDFGFISPIAAGLPHEFLTLGRWLRPLLAFMLPNTRYVDQVEVRLDSPQEDEIPLSAMNPISFYHGIYFPRRFERHFRRSMYLEGCTAAEIEAWQHALGRFLEKNWLEQGRRLVIKNPTYTGRMPLLRKLYPEARFIHIHRNPHEVFRSTRHFYRTLLERFALQPFDHLDLDRFVLEGYQRLMDRVEHDQHALPANRFVELRFEDLETRPLAEIRRIYDVLELGDATAIEPCIRAHLEQVAGFQKNAFSTSPEDRALVERHWRPFLDRLGYAAPPRAAPFEAARRSVSGECGRSSTPPLDSR
jgi:hypothetical protein